MKKSFEVVSEFKPAGDQPEAIRQLVEGIENGLAHQTLLGVTGSGKTFTIANVIEKVERPWINIELIYLPLRLRSSSWWRWSR